MADPYTVAVFRQRLPEFGDDVAYPPDEIQFWLDAGYVDFDGVGFGENLNRATSLFVAHMLTLGARAKTGQVGSLSGGFVTSKSIDKVSVSYDASLFTEKGAGFWGMTSYGLQFWWMLRSRIGFVYRARPGRFTLAHGRYWPWS